jgi:uncharacterized membrane protein
MHSVREFGLALEMFSLLLGGGILQFTALLFIAFRATIHVEACGLE